MEQLDKHGGSFLFTKLGFCCWHQRYQCLKPEGDGWRVVWNPAQPGWSWVGSTSIWSFLYILMKIQLPRDIIALLGIFTQDWTFDVTFCLNKQAHMVNDCLVRVNIVCLRFVKNCQGLRKFRPILREKSGFLQKWASGCRWVQLHKERQRNSRRRRRGAED